MTTVEKSHDKLSGDSTRSQLIEAAKKIFALKGYDGATVKQLADQAGVNVSLVSYHFDGKLGLYRACFEEFGKQRLLAAERLLQGPGSVEDFRLRIAMYVEEIFRFHIEEPEVTAIVHRECEIQNSIVQDIFRETFLRSFEVLVTFMKTAQKNKIILAGLDAQVVSTMLFSAVMHTAKSDSLNKRYFNQTIHDVKYRKKISEQIIKMFLGGVLSK